MTLTLPSKALPEFVSGNDKIILFDGVCKLCNAWSKFIIKYDTQHVFKLCSVQSKEGQALLRSFGYPDDYYETMLLIDATMQQATSFEKSDAFFSVMSGLGWPWRALNVFRLLPPFLRNWLYDRIALNRYAIFGKYDSCILPSADHDRRFLDGC